MGRIFISYRREDSQGEALHLCEDLKSQFGNDNVFLDVVGIEPGKDFRTAIASAVDGCDALIVIIGRSWINMADETGQRRLDDPGDFVRLETATALQRNIPVVPVLVQGASMPTTQQLPGVLEPLAWRQSFEIRHTRWKADLTELVKGLRKILLQLSGRERKRAKARSTIVIGALSAALVVVFFGVFFRQHFSQKHTFDIATGEGRTKIPSVSPRNQTRSEVTPDAKRSKPAAKERINLIGRWTGSSSCTVVIYRDDGTDIEGECNVNGFKHRITGTYVNGNHLSMAIVRTDSNNCETTVIGSITILDRNHVTTRQAGWNGCGVNTEAVTTELLRQ